MEKKSIYKLSIQSSKYDKNIYEISFFYKDKDTIICQNLLFLKSITATVYLAAVYPFALIKLLLYNLFDQRKKVDIA